MAAASGWPMKISSFPLSHHVSSSRQRLDRLIDSWICGVSRSMFNLLLYHSVVHFYDTWFLELSNYWLPLFYSQRLSRGHDAGSWYNEHFYRDATPDQIMSRMERIKIKGKWKREEKGPALYNRNMLFNLRVKASNKSPVADGTGVSSSSSESSKEVFLASNLPHPIFGNPSSSLIPKEIHFHTHMQHGPSRASMPFSTVPPMHGEPLLPRSNSCASIRDQKSFISDSNHRVVPTAAHSSNDMYFFQKPSSAATMMSHQQVLCQAVMSPPDITNCDDELSCINPVQIQPIPIESDTPLDEFAQFIDEVITHVWMKLKRVPTRL